MNPTTDIGVFSERTAKNGRFAMFLDIDGTMIEPLSPGGVPPRLARAISRAQEKGHLFFVNSGRALGYISKALLASAPFDGVVSGMGGHIVYNGEPIYRSLLSRELKEKIADHCEKYGESIIFEGEPEEDGYDGRYCFGDSSFFEVERTFSDKNRFLEAVYEKNIIKITTSYVPCERYASFLDEDFDMVYMPPIYAEGALRGNNKGTAILRVCEILGIPRENTVAVGDSENDIGMLTAAGISAAMGTAPEEVKSICDIVCDSVKNDGAAKLIEKLFL